MAKVQGIDPTEDVLAAQATGNPNEDFSNEPVTDAPSNSAGAQGSPSDMTPTSMPGVLVDRTQFVVLASRLGRKMEALPKKDPNDDREEVKYAVPDPYERGETVNLSDIWQDPTGKVDNVKRLLRTGAIGFLDHPDALGAREGLRYRRSQEELVQADRGILAR